MSCHGPLDLLQKTFKSSISLSSKQIIFLSDWSLNGTSSVCNRFPNPWNKTPCPPNLLGKSFQNKRNGGVRTGYCKVKVETWTKAGQTE